MNNKSRVKVIIIVIVLSLALIFGSLYVSMYMLGMTKEIPKKTGNHVNNTNLNYKAEDVDLNCVMDLVKENRTSKLYVDIIFDYEGAYQAAIFNRVYSVFNNEITDEEYKEHVSKFSSIYCIREDSCKENHLDLGITSYGKETTIDRNGKELTTTYIEYRGIGGAATEEGKEAIKSSYEKVGYTCK